MNTLGFQQLKVVALAVDDAARAASFYRNTLEFEPAPEEEDEIAFTLGDVILMLKPASGDWPAHPSANLNPRLTLATDDALQCEQALLARGVTISDPVVTYPEAGYSVGAFLDSEGNKLWFCSLLAAGRGE